MPRSLALLLLIAACDPAVTDRLTVSLPASFAPDSGRAAALGIADRIARRNQLQTDTVGRCATAYSIYYNRDPRPGWSHNVTLVLCISSPQAGSLRFEVSESFTTQWGARGDSVREELRDSLLTLFGGRAVKG